MRRFDLTDGRRVTWVGIITDLIIVIVKFVCGFAGKSNALIADAIHSISDIISSCAVLVGLRYSEKPQDAEHPYGHGKIESLVALFVGILICFTGIFLVSDNVQLLIRHEFHIPNLIALVAVLFSIGSKEWLFRYTIQVGEKLNSPSVTANAWHHRSDVYSSLAVLVGILGAILGIRWFDAAAAVIVAGFVLKASYHIIKDSVDDLIDRQMPRVLREKIHREVTQWNPNYHVESIYGRRMGSWYRVNLKIQVNAYEKTLELYDDFRNLEMQILTRVPYIQDVDIDAVVDAEQAKDFEAHIKTRIDTILDEHVHPDFRIEHMDFHILKDELEIHFHMLVNPDMTVRESHHLTELVQLAIEKEFTDAQVIIHVEPLT